jgi:hypothetical protein
VFVAGRFPDLHPRKASEPLGVPTVKFIDFSPRVGRMEG